MKTIKLLFLTVVAAVLVSCGTTRTVPITGRKQNLIVSDEQVLSLSNQEYTKYMNSAKKSTNAEETAMVQRVGKRLATAVESYLKNNGMGSELSQYSWEFNLVQDKNVNAFCMPGGKIVVYEGLLPVTKDETSLAIVLGHEIAHAVAKHSAEQMSKAYRQQYATQIGSAVASALGVGSTAVSLGQWALQNGFQFRNLKYSRDNELEADHMGLIFAAMAGYNPEEAIPFWQRMASLSGSGSNDILSDHPSDAKRIAAIKTEMPEALKYYKPAATTTSTTTAKQTTTTNKKSTTTTRKKATTTRRKTTTKRRTTTK